MKVVLLENIRGLGRVGDVKNVPDGYAHNFLLPRKLAQPAHSHLINQIEDLKKKSTMIAEKEIETAKEIVSMMSAEDFILELKGKANKEGGLYAAISESKISAALKEKGLKVSSDDIKIENPIKSVGDHEVVLDFGNEVRAKLKLRVQP
jgi:large subunit ribosomal protein L9